MKKKNRTKITSWEEHLDEKYGKSGSESRERFEESFAAFKIGVMLQAARKKRNLTQEELALRIGTTKNYISRIENNASDIRLSTLMRIISEGLGGKLSFTLDI